MSSSVISSSSSSSETTKDEKQTENGKFLCTAQGCNQTFTSTNELAIHEQKHQMTLKLGPVRGLTDMLPFDQTPTPTKFLQYGKETGLFEEISNPFDSEFKRGTGTSRLREKAQRSAVPGLIIDPNKARTPTSLPFASQPGQPVAQPVHVITLTPTLPSPVIGGGQLFIPPLPSPQGFLPSPAALISPSIVPFSAPGLFPSVQAVVEAQHAALAQAFLNAASASNATLATSNSNQNENESASQTQMASSRTTSIADLPNSTALPFPTQTVSVPVNNNSTPPTCHAMPGPNIPSAAVGSASVIQQHVQPSIEQRRPLSQSNSLDHPTHPNPGHMERKPSFHGETSVITQAPAHSSTSQMNNNMIMHTGNATGYQYMTSQQSLPPFSQIADASVRMSNHPVLTSSRSVPTPSQNNIQNHQHTLPHQNSLPGIDAKQKLKETLTTNNPNLHMELPTMHQQYSLDLDLDDDEKSLNEVSSSSGISDGQKAGRRRGRRNDDDPDTKRMRFLERNRAAASRCRAKKKQWVTGLEAKAKELSNSNVGLQNEVAHLREEVASLKQLLLAHRDCPITRLQQQKLAIAGGDPSAVVSNPVQAAASLLGIEKEENIEMQGNEGSQANNGDVKPGMPNMEMQMTSSLLVSANHACKSECSMDEFPQVSSTSAIALNTNFAGSNPNLSTSAGT